LRASGIGFNIALDQGWVGAWHADEYGVWNKSGQIWPDLDPHYWGYPALHLYLLAALNGITFWGARLVGIASDLDYHSFLDLIPGTRYLLARMVSVVAAGATAWLVMRRGRELAGGAGAALIAGVLLTLNPLHVQHSHYGTLDALFVLLCSAAVIALVAVAERGGARDHLRAGLLMGLAMSQKYNAVALLLPYAGALGWAWSRRGSPPWRAPVLAGAALAAFTVLLINLAFLVHFQDSWAELQRNLGRVVSLDTGTGDARPLGEYFFLLGRHMGFGLMALAALGFGFMVRSRPGAALVVALWLGGFYCLMSSFGLRVPRYILPIVPILLVLAAGAVVVPFRRLPVRTRAGLTALLLAAALAEVLPALATVQTIFHTPDSRLVASRWISDNIPVESSIAVESNGEYGPSVSGQRYQITNFSFLEGQPMYGPFVKRVPFLLVGESDSAATEILSDLEGMCEPRHIMALELDATSLDAAEQMAARVARDMVLQTYALHANRDTGDFPALLRLAPDYVVLSQWMYGNPETRPYRNFYVELQSHPGTALIARFPALPYDYSVHHPEIRVYRIGSQPLRRGSDVDGYFPHDGGASYVMDVPANVPSDEPNRVGRSRLALLEDDVPLGPAHQGHQAIRRSGGGRYSHWQGKVFFSTSDGSDPNGNGRSYTWIELQ